LTLWYSAVLAISLVAFATTVWFAMRGSLLHAVDNHLTDQSAGLARFLAAEASTADTAVVEMEAREYAASLSGDQILRVWDYNGRLLLTWPEAIGDASQTTDVGFHRWSFHDRELRSFQRMVSLGGKGYRVELGISLQEVKSTLTHLRSVLLACIPMVLALAAAGGWWLSRRALAPVDAMTREAHALSVDNLAARLKVPDTRDEIARLAEAWNGVLTRLQSAVERVMRFTADASHELRTPVALIRTTAELSLRQQRSVREYQDAMRQIENESQRMSQLLEDLLFLARFDAGNETSAVRGVHISDFDLREFAQSVCEGMKILAAEHDVRLSCRALQQPVMVRGDTVALRRLIVLITDNAIKYTSEGGAVEVWTGQHGGDAVLEVRDTGPGIAVDDLPHVFERFWRADKARTSGNGIGLGLALAQSIAQANGGRIEAESELNLGSTFRVLLPLAPEHG
jgi:two-component system, OmpR family, heavy metal sensor histidine kinase CusS